MNIIIVGCGRVGRSIAEQLNTEGHSITVIDVNHRELEMIYDTENIMAIEGNGATYSVLNEAGVADCDLLIAVTATDELNLYTCLLAKNAGVASTIARVRNPEYISDVSLIKDDLKLSLAINPEYTCASEIARLVKYVGVLSISSFAGGKIDLIKIEVREKSQLADKRLVDIAPLLKGGVRFAFIERYGELYIPSGDFTLRVGDQVSFVAPSAVAARLLKNLSVISSKARTVMILGGSKIGFYLAKILKETGLNVKIFEYDPERCEDLSEDLPGVMIINGNAMDEDLLLSEGIERADAVVCLMDTDEGQSARQGRYRARQPEIRVRHREPSAGFHHPAEASDGSVYHPLCPRHAEYHRQQRGNDVFDRRRTRRGAGIPCAREKCADRCAALQAEAQERPANHLYHPRRQADHSRRK